jgi:hypothetical protein
MSATRPASPLVAHPAPQRPKTRGFLHIERHRGTSGSMYVVTFHRLQPEALASRPRPMLAEDAHALIVLLEHIGVDFRLGEVRGALEDVLRLGSANIPDVWLTDEEILERGLIET